MIITKTMVQTLIDRCPLNVDPAKYIAFNLNDAARVHRERTVALVKLREAAKVYHEIKELIDAELDRIQRTCPYLHRRLTFCITCGKELT